MAFTKGHTLSKGKGRPKLTPEEKGARELTDYNFRTIANKYFYTSVKDLNEILKTNPVMIEVIVIRLLIKCASTGDKNNIEFLMDRLLGKPKQIVVQHNYDETKSKSVEIAEKLLLKILIDEKKDTMDQEYIAQGLLPKDS